ncbi:MAG: hypothetical protein JWN84_1423 [Nocardioides sp.]|nr:hypothetical protein [Nocardioides sp.]
MPDHGVEEVALGVVRRDVGLGAPGLVGRPGQQLVRAGRRAPGDGPAGPAEAAVTRSGALVVAREGGAAPRGPAVGADVDVGDRGGAAPRAAGEGAGGLGGDRRAERQLPGRAHRVDGEGRRVGRVGTAGQAVERRVPRRGQLAGRHLERAEPLDASDADPPRQHEAQREAVVGQQVLAVGSPGQDRVVERLGDRERPADAAVVGAAAHEPVVQAGGLEGDRSGRDAEPTQHVAQPDALPRDRADRTELPCRAADLLSLLGGEEAAAVAGALVHRGVPDVRQRLEVSQAQRERVGLTARRPEPVAEHAQAVGRRVDDGGGSVVAHEQVGLRRQVAPGVDGVPAHLRVGAEVDEPRGRQRLEDAGRPGGGRTATLDERRGERADGRGGQDGTAGRAGSRGHAGQRNTTMKIDLSGLRTACPRAGPAATLAP